MRDGEMALLPSVKGQEDKRQLPRIHPLHEVVDSILCSILHVIGLAFPNVRRRFMAYFIFNLHQLYRICMKFH